MHIRPSLRSIAFACVLVLVGAVPAFAADGPAGHWEGAIELPNRQLEVDVDLVHQDSGWTGDISIPAQGASDLPLVDITVEGRAVGFRIQGVPGEPTFDGELAADGATLGGTFTQGGQSFDFRLERAAAPAAQAGESLADLRATIEQALEDFEVPGLGVAVVVDGEPVLVEGFGQRNLDTGEPVTADTLFAIGSATKAFTTAVLATLVDEGLLEWDEPVADYLPGFKLADPHASRALNVMDLVTHVSGLPRHDAVWYNNPETRAGLLERLRYLEPNQDLREQFQYQNLMYMTAGLLVEELTGASWEQAVRARLLDPLGMPRTNFTVREMGDSSDGAAGHDLREDELQVIPYRDITTMGPAGSINSNPAEMTRWLLLHLGDGTLDGERILDEANLRLMHTPQVSLKSFPAKQDILLTSYGPGWFIDAYRGLYRVHHGGNIDGFSALVTLLPFEDVGIVVLANRNATSLPELVTRTIIDRVTGLEPQPWIPDGLAEYQAAKQMAEEAEEKAAETRIEGTSPSHPLADYAGRYEHPGYGTMEIVREGEQLSVRFHELEAPLEHWHYDVFRAGEADDPALEKTQFQFRNDASGYVAELVVPLEPLVDPIVFERQPDERLSDPDYLQRFAGVYQLGPQRLTISVSADHLVAALPGQPTYELAPVRGTTFALEPLTGYRVIFRENEAGEVTGLAVEQPNGLFEADKVE
jgi:CubicO group peptidase (beta-lactamase class C family)